MLRPVSSGVSLLPDTLCFFVFFGELNFIWGKKRTAAWKAASDSSERPLQRGRWGRSIHKISGKGELNAIQ